MNQSRINIKWYIIVDILTAVLTWVCFYYLRTLIYGCAFTIPPGFYLGLFLYTAGWLSLHFLTGAYESIYRKTILDEVFKTILTCTIGCLLLLFFFILKNPLVNNDDYYLEFFSLLVPVTLLTILLRLPFLIKAKNQLWNKKVYYNTLLIGTEKSVSQFYQSLINSKTRGYRITSFLSINGNKEAILPSNINQYNNLDDITSIIDLNKIEEVIITVDKTDRTLLTRILQRLSDKNVNIKITPDTVDIISGAIKTKNLSGIPLIDVHSGQLPVWQKNIKRFIDIIAAVLGIIFLSPLLIFTAIRTRLSSKGAILFLQERIGYKGKPFTIFKFRSMVQDAEKDGPALSSTDDPRITNWGKVMRKWRLDELPQLWNILKGEMSLVGPRPERKFYVDQIVQQHPEYKYLFKVKPGLSSWGMVKFGYASSVDEMIQRMQYDLLYIENVSIILDLEIMLLTLRIIFAGKGK
ncbi:sugar transferase [Ferruginibacter albus]|uniref:sugar transferase n=1 Tax=Ferruginibacter albus TaxID=2875540 RepID=UPI001CC3AF2F|nr:sugar transferase [Ferruginibacter albus]UAY50826.1 sugar transferase [Ferruginibacter albus]